MSVCLYVCLGCPGGVMVSTLKDWVRVPARTTKKYSYHLTVCRVSCLFVSDLFFLTTADEVCIVGVLSSLGFAMVM